MLMRLSQPDTDAPLSTDSYDDIPDFGSLYDSVPAYGNVRARDDSSRRREQLRSRCEVSARHRALPRDAAYDDDRAAACLCARIPRVRWTEQVSETELIYYVTEPGESEPRRFVQRFDMRWYLRAELIHLLARAGFSVQTINGDFDASALTDESPEMVVVAVKNPASS
jgi:hypothetical protein